jgi:hypothetical protein
MLLLPSREARAVERAKKNPPAREGRRVCECPVRMSYPSSAQTPPAARIRVARRRVPQIPMMVIGADIRISISGDDFRGQPMRGGYATITPARFTLSGGSSAGERDTQGRFREGSPTHPSHVD